MNFLEQRQNVDEKGFATVEQLYTKEEVDAIIQCIDKAESNASFMKTKDLYAIRQLLKNIPALSPLIFNERLQELLSSLFEENYFLTKAIYFDKPSDSNWFVAYHQDISISVAQKNKVEGYTNWTFKKGQYGVIPPSHILEGTRTIRIHLDDTDSGNGALKVIPKSHLNGIIRIEDKNWDCNDQVVCQVKKGGAMLMTPLTLHASDRTTNEKRRRVIHLEFNRHQLKEPLEWLEFEPIYPQKRS